MPSLPGDDAEPGPPAIAAPLPAWTPGLAPVIALSLGGAVLVMVSYTLATVLALVTLPAAPRLALAAAQAAGLLLPACGLIAFARFTGLLAPAVSSTRVRPSLALGIATWSFVVAILAAIIWSATLALLVPDVLVSMQAHLEMLYGPLFLVQRPLDVASVLLALSIVPALCEEVLFRGFVQRVLRSRLPAAWSIGITSVIFAAVHVDAIGFPSRVILAVALGMAFERTASLRLPMFMHAAYNLLALVVMPWDVAEALAVPPPHEAMLMIAAALPAIVPATWLWLRTLRALPGGAPA